MISNKLGIVFKFCFFHFYCPNSGDFIYLGGGSNIIIYGDACVWSRQIFWKLSEPLVEFIEIIYRRVVIKQSNKAADVKFNHFIGN